MSEASAGSRFTPGELKVASWWVRHQLQVRKVLRFSLIALCAGLWGYVFWGLLNAFAIAYPRESRLTREIALNQQRLAALEADRPQDVSLSQVTVLATTDNRSDMMVEISNPNEQWWAEFTYRFSLSGEDTPLRSGFVLPKSQQVLTELGFKSKSVGGRSASLVVETVRWHRLDPKQVGSSFADYTAKRFMLRFEQVTYDTDIALDSKRVGRTQFILVNPAGYGYWGVDLIVRMYRGPSLVGVNQIRAERIKPDERRPMQLIWLDNIPGVTKTEIIPQVNILDPNAYLSSQYF